MGVLSRLLSGSLRAETPGPFSDFWYTEAPGVISSAGVRVDEETAQQVSGFFRGLTLLSNDVAKLPLELYQRQADGGKKRAINHPLYDLLHTAPNPWQSSFEWRRQGMRNLILRGNWYSRLVPGPRGFADRMIPIPPDLVTPKQLDNGRIVWDVRDPKTSATTRLVEGEVFHVRGASDDGIVGKSLLTWARESLGIARATESYASKLFSQGALHGGLISVPGVLDDEASKRMAASFVTSQANWHMPKVLEQGATYTENTLTPEDSQFLTSRQFSVTEMARWLGVPPHKIFDLSRSTNNNIEHQGIEYFGDGLQPWLVLIEQSILRDLIIAQKVYFAEFNAEGTLRADSAARAAFYQGMFQVGAMSPNDILARENQNKVEGGDQRFVPANMRPLDEPFSESAAGGSPFPPPSPAKPAAPPPVEDEPDSEQARAITLSASQRLLTKEIAAVQKAAVRHSGDLDTFAAEVTAFYAKHAALVAVVLHVSAEQAEAYCARQVQQVTCLGWLEALETWKADDYAAGLAGLALEGAEA